MKLYIIYFLSISSTMLCAIPVCILDLMKNCAVQLEGTTVDSFDWGKLSWVRKAYTLSHCQCYRSEVDLYSMNNLGAMWWCSVDHNEEMPGTMIVCILHVGYIFDSHHHSCIVIRMYCHQRLQWCSYEYFLKWLTWILLSCWSLVLVICVNCIAWGHCNRPRKYNKCLTSKIYNQATAFSRYIFHTLLQWGAKNVQMINI